jgi:hypothetical protein
MWSIVAKVWNKPKLSPVTDRIKRGTAAMTNNCRRDEMQYERNG